jgi:hypothetical protein
MRKDPLAVYQEEYNITSPQADVVLEAEFSVDGISNYLRLTNPVPAGTRITVIRRTGKTWYDRGVNTATTGETLFRNQSPVPAFIKQRSTELPE